MSEVVSAENFYHVIYTESNSEFERVRSACLEEDNWLRDNYLPKNLDLDNYYGFSVIYDKSNDAPVGMAGLFNPDRYPSNVAQHLHREYLFPNYRRKTYAGLVSGFSLYNEHIVKPLNKLNSFDTYFIAMQNRYKKLSKGYWKVFSNALCEGMPGWKIGDGYLQTCQADVQKCWQNYCYFGNWDSWNKTLMSQNDWDKLIQGD